MNGDEIEHFFKRTPLYQYLKGIVSIDMIKAIEKLPDCHFLVFNESKKISKGTHWLCLTKNLFGNYAGEKF